MAIMFTGSVVFAQQTVTGTVTDDDGPLPGANVVVKGTNNGTMTDFDGNYSLDNVASDGILVISFVGFGTREINVNGESSINIALVEDANALDEVIVTGYVTQTRGDVTGSVASVDMDEAVKVPMTNAAQALQGRVAGVTVVSNNTPGGTPKINIRGMGTTNNSNPLYIIDGVQTDDPNALNNLNPADIEQMNVLKDGAAAIYGARASNGVVIITTKSGGYNMANATMSLDVYTGVSVLNGGPELLNAQQHSDMLFQSLTNDGGSLFHGQYNPNNTSSFSIPTTILGYTRVASYNPIVQYPAGVKSATVQPGGTDWVDEMTETAPITNVSFSMANGTETGKYYMSMNYLKQDGVVIYTGFERISTKLNSEFKVADRLKVGEHINISYTNTQTGVAGALDQASRISPLIPVRDDEGLFAGVAGPSLSNSRSPVANNFRARDDYVKRYSVFGDAYLSFDFLEPNELTFKTVLGFGFNTFDSRAFTALDPEHGEPISTNNLYEQDQTSWNWIWSNTLSYNKTFGDHKVNALIGIEALKGGGKGKGVRRSGYLFETPDFYLLNNGTGAPSVQYAYDGFSSLWSIFGTANYAYQSKYYFTATLRQDTSSRFLGDNQTDIFPSFSAGWVLSNEDFYGDSGFFERIKFKGSWGQLGNQSLPADNPTINISNLNEGQANYALNGSSIATGAILSQVGNPDLVWETSESINFGIELVMLNNRLTFDLEGYQIKTKDLITRDFSLISTTAIDAGAPLVNLGDIQNTGFDLVLGWHDTTDSGFSYGIDANISRYKNEVLELINGAPVGGTTTGLRGQQPTRTEVGDEMSYYYGYKVVGFTDTGRFLYDDYDGDGNAVGDSDDRQKLGSPHPDFTYGTNIDLAYKGFDMSLFFLGSQGNELYNFNKYYTDFPAFSNGNRSTRVLDSWTPTNTNASLPALSTSITNDEGLANSYYVEDGSYFRLKNLQLGYSLPDSLTEKMKMSAFRIYIQGTNLFTITDYSGMDPELISYDNLSLGIDRIIYPSAKAYTLGVNIKF